MAVDSVNPSDSARQAEYQQQEAKRVEREQQQQQEERVAEDAAENEVDVSG